MEELTGVANKSFRVSKVSSPSATQRKAPLTRPLPKDAVNISNEALEKAKIDRFVQMLKAIPDISPTSPPEGQNPIQVVADKLVDELFI